MALPLAHDRWPAIAEQNQRPWIQNSGLQLVPNQRDFRDRTHAATQSDVSNGTSDQSLQSFIEMFRRHFLCQITIRLGLELIHRDADDTPTTFVRATAR